MLLVSILEMIYIVHLENRMSRYPELTNSIRALWHYLVAGGWNELEISKT